MRNKNNKSKKMKGGVWPFTQTSDATTNGVSNTKPVVNDYELNILKTKMEAAKVTYDQAKDAYYKAKPRMFGLFGGKTKKNRSKK